MTADLVGKRKKTRKTAGVTTKAAMSKKRGTRRLARLHGKNTELIGLGSSGHIYACNTMCGRVFRYREDGHLEHEWKTDLFAIRPNESVIASATVSCDDGWCHTELLNTMREVERLRIFPPGLLPICVAYALGDYIYVVHGRFHEIQVYRECGELFDTWKVHPDLHNKSHWTRDSCSVGYSKGFLCVALYVTGILYVFDSRGILQYKWSGVFGGGISINREGHVYFYLMNNSRCIQAIDIRDGTQVYRGIISFKHYPFPEQVCVGQNGKLFLKSGKFLSLVDLKAATPSVVQIIGKVRYNNNLDDKFLVGYDGRVYFTHCENGVTYLVTDDRDPFASS